MARRGGQWMPCPAGQLRSLADKLRRRRRRRRFLHLAGVAAIAAGGIISWRFGSGLAPELPDPGEPAVDGIACAQVMERAEAYAKGQLSETVRDQIRRHLSQCSSCRSFFEARGLL